MRCIVSRKMRRRNIYADWEKNERNGGDVVVEETGDPPPPPPQVPGAGRRLRFRIRGKTSREDVTKFAEDRTNRDEERRRRWMRCHMCGRHIPPTYSHLFWHCTGVPSALRPIGVERVHDALQERMGWPTGRKDRAAIDGMIAKQLADIYLYLTDEARRRRRAYGGGAGDPHRTAH